MMANGRRYEWMNEWWWSFWIKGKERKGYWWWDEDGWRSACFKRETLIKMALIQIDASCRRYRSFIVVELYVRYMMKLSSLSLSLSLSLIIFFCIRYSFPDQCSWMFEGSSLKWDDHPTKLLAHDFSRRPKENLFFFHFFPPHKSYFFCTSIKYIQHTFCFSIFYIHSVVEHTQYENSHEKSWNSND